MNIWLGETEVTYMGEQPVKYGRYKGKGSNRPVICKGEKSSTGFNVKAEEFETVGLVSWSKLSSQENAITENYFRRQLGYNLRGYY